MAPIPNSGVIAVGALPRTGQTIQFQRRDAAAAVEDMNELLTRAEQQLKGTTIYGGCLCSCNGRGRGLFGLPNHDAETIQQPVWPNWAGGFFLQWRNRARRRKEFSSRLYRIAGVVREEGLSLTRSEHALFSMKLTSIFGNLAFLAKLRI